MGLEEELTKMGIRYIGGLEGSKDWPTTMSTEEFKRIAEGMCRLWSYVCYHAVNFTNVICRAECVQVIPKDLGAVVVGFDGDFNYYKLCLASAALQKAPVRRMFPNLGALAERVQYLIIRFLFPRMRY